MGGSLVYPVCPNSPVCKTVLKVLTSRDSVRKKEAKLLAWWLAHSINGSYYYYLTHRALEAQRRKLPGGHSARGTQADVWEDG